MRTVVEVKTNIRRTPSVMQVEGLFDVPPAAESVLSWSVNLPIEEKPWSIGAIIGPSGCGKSTVARNVFAAELARYEQIAEHMRSKPDHSLLDLFPERLRADEHTTGIRAVVSLLSSVGFSSPPSWLRPFNVLSNGEQFRVMMARILADAIEHPGAIAVVDEFTSVVDRTVAQIGSCAVAKAVRRAGARLVAVTCHDDVVPWLQPDWVYYPAEQRFAWRSVQPRPQVRISVFRVQHGTWRFFQRYHYLTHELNKAAICFAAFVEMPGHPPRLACFDSWLPFFGKSNGKIRRGTRLVCMPDFQGLGIGQKLETFIASMWGGLGFRAVMGTSHPAIITARKRDRSWKMTTAPKMRAKGAHSIDASRSSDRNMASFEYVGPKMPNIQAQRVLGNWKIV